MAAPAFGSAGTYLTHSYTASAVVDAPPGAAADDIIVVHVHRELNADPSAIPSGFTLVDFTPDTASTSSMRQYVFWKRATSSEPSTYTFTWATEASRSAVATRWTGCVTSGTPFDVLNAAARNSGGTVTPAVSATTTGADRMLVWAGTNWQRGSWTPPTGFTERVDDAAGGSITVASKDQASAGATGSLTGTSSVSDWQIATLLALLPAAATGPGAGTATGSWAYTGAAAGSRASQGAAAGTAAFTGAAAGTSTRRGNATGSATFTGAATGEAPSTTRTETFTGANNASLAAADVDLTWTDVVTGWSVASNQAAATATDAVQYARAEHDIAVDMFAEATTVTLTDGGDTTQFAVLARYSASENTCYMVCRGLDGPNDIAIRRTLTGSRATLATATVARTAGETIRIEVEGTAIRGYINGVLAVSTTNTDITTGQRGGLYAFLPSGGSVVVDDFQAGLLTDTAEGAATGGWSFTGAAAGARTSQGAATGAWTYAGAATGSTTRSGTSTGTFTYTGTAAGVSTRSGTATGTTAWVGAATGSAPSVGVSDGTGSGTWAFTGAAGGVSTRAGSGTGTWTFTGAAAGQSTRRGTATGTAAFTGAATGASARNGTGSGTTAWTGVALSGNARAGAGSGTSTWSGTATGASVRRGNATGTWATSGSAVGSATRSGAATGSWSTTGTATGVTPAVAIPTGSGSGTAAYVGVAAGIRASRGNSTGTYAYQGSATGATVHRGSSTGAWSTAGAATGMTGLFQFSGLATGMITYVGVAVGSSPVLLGTMHPATRPVAQARPATRQVAHMRVPA